MKVYVEKGNSRGKRANLLCIDDAIELELRIKEMIEEIIEGTSSEELDNLKEIVEWIKENGNDIVDKDI